MDGIARCSLLVDPLRISFSIRVQHSNKFLCIFAGADFIGVLAVFTGSHGNSRGCGLITLLNIVRFFLSTNRANIVAVRDIGAANAVSLTLCADHVTHIVAVVYTSFSNLTGDSSHIEFRFVRITLHTNNAAIEAVGHRLSI